MIDDPGNLLSKAINSGLGYIWFVVLAAWGGIANYVTRVNAQKTPFSFMELIGECAVSGFVGLITMYVCFEMGFSFYITAAATGIAGHMGGRIIGLTEYWVLTKFEGWLNRLSGK